MNNPLMYNDPDGEFWLALGGALLGGYLNGVAANGGKWNPGKWDWEKTWSAVLGGAIGGAAISGTLRNIASNPGAFKFVLPSIVSGGLNSAFTGGNFLGGAVGGLSYTANVFENKMTSTDLTDSPYGGYKMNVGNFYFASSDMNDEEPVNFFGKTDEKVFHDKFKEMQKTFGMTKGDGIFRVFAHGYEGGIWDGDNLIKDADTFDKVMGSKNPRWKNVDKMEKSMLLLYSCLSGYDNKQIQSIGQKISIQHPKTVVVGFEKWIPYTTNVPGFPMVNRFKDSTDNWGWAKVYLNGIIIKHQLYRDFIK
ncbi:hypothetical protein [Chryseobacterium sp. Mn2064]|uniref:hypothetical protein n=1 Tax=Chryseobacterium sp. Mn2064 TaxID=3395263 RepID=UPI003BBA4E53